jgi:hypothetical protein
LVNHRGPLGCNKRHFSCELASFSEQKRQVHAFTQPMESSVQLATWQGGPATAGTVSPGVRTNSSAPALINNTLPPLLGGREQEDHGSRPAQAKSVRLYLE